MSNSELWKKSLDDCVSFLVDNLTLTESFLSRLIENNVLTPVFVQLVKDKDTNEARIDQLVRLLKERSYGNFLNFLQILDQTGNESCHMVMSLKNLSTLSSDVALKSSEDTKRPTSDLVEHLKEELREKDKIISRLEAEKRLLQNENRILDEENEDLKKNIETQRQSLSLGQCQNEKSPPINQISNLHIGVQQTKLQLLRRKDPPLTPRIIQNKQIDLQKMTLARQRRFSEILRPRLSTLNTVVEAKCETTVVRKSTRRLSVPDLGQPRLLAPEVEDVRSKYCLFCRKEYYQRDECVVHIKAIKSGRYACCNTDANDTTGCRVLRHVYVMFTGVHNEYFIYDEYGRHLAFNVPTYQRTNVPTYQRTDSEALSCKRDDYIQ